MPRITRPIGKVSLQAGKHGHQAVKALLMELGSNRQDHLLVSSDIPAGSQAIGSGLGSNRGIGQTIALGKTAVRRAKPR